MTDIDIIARIRPAPADDRRTCNACAHLVGGRCQANESTVLRDVPRDVLHRCGGFRATTSRVVEAR